MDETQTTDNDVDEDPGLNRAQRRGQGMTTMRMNGTYRTVHGQFRRIAKPPEERTPAQARQRKAARKRAAKSRRH